MAKKDFKKLDRKYLDKKKNSQRQKLVQLYLKRKKILNSNVESVSIKNKFASILSLNGEKKVSEKIILNLIKLLQIKTSKNPKLLIKRTLLSARTFLLKKHRRIRKGRNVVRIPISYFPKTESFRISDSLKFFRKSARTNRVSSSLFESLANEILKINENEEFNSVISRLDEIKPEIKLYLKTLRKFRWKKRHV